MEGKGLRKAVMACFKVLPGHLSGMAEVTTDTSVRIDVVQSEIGTE
jgi:hypothetical protein